MSETNEEIYLRNNKGILFPRRSIRDIKFDPEYRDRINAFMLHFGYNIFDAFLYIQEFDLRRIRDGDKVDWDAYISSRIGRKSQISAAKEQLELLEA
jgi:hypothetical protein